MIENAVNAYKAYIDVMQGAEEARDEAFKQLEATYQHTSAEYLQKRAAVNDTFHEKAAQEKQKAAEVITAAFDNARAAVKAAAMKAPSSDLVTMLSMVEGVEQSDTEKAAIYDACAGNYMALRKLLSLVKYPQDMQPTRYEDVAEDLDGLQEAMVNALDLHTFKNLNYKTMLVYEGSMYERADADVTAFLQQFSGSAAA